MKTKTILILLALTCYSLIYSANTILFTGETTPEAFSRMDMCTWSNAAGNYENFGTTESPVYARNTDNPDKSGINSTNKVLHLKSLQGHSWWPDFLNFNLNTPITITNENRYLHIFMYRENQNYGFSVSINTEHRNGEAGKSWDMNLTAAGKWEDVVVDLKWFQDNSTAVSLITVAMDLNWSGNAESVTNYYFDEIILSNNPLPRPYLSGNNLYDFEPGTAANASIWINEGTINADNTVTYPFANPMENAKNTTAKVFKRSVIANALWYTQSIMTFSNTVQVDATHKYLHFLVSVPVAGQKILCYIKQCSTDAAINSEYTITDANTWQDVVIDLSSIGYFTALDFRMGHWDGTAVGDYYCDEIWIDDSPTPRTNADVTLTNGNPTMGSVSGAGTFTKSVSTTVTATPNAGYRFVNWTLNTSGGAEQSTSASYTFTVSGATTLVANFVQQFAVAASAGTGGSITSGAGTYDSGASATVIAAANAGYRFVNWTLNSSGGAEQSTSASYAFTVSDAKILVANFATIDVTVPTGTSINASFLTNCTSCDVTIGGANTVLTINENKTLNSITASTGGKLVVSQPLTVSGAVVIDAGAKLDLSNTLAVNGDLTFKATDTETFSANLGTGGINVTGNVIYQRTIDDKKWYFMSFPCNIDVNTITVDGGRTLGSTWFIKEYDGDNRAKKGTGSNWFSVTSGSTLTAYKGYIFGIATGTATLNFPLTKTIVLSETAKTIDVTNYTGAAASTDHGWNLVGQPYLSKYNANNGSNMTNMWKFNGLTYNDYYNDAYVQNLPVVDPFAAYFTKVTAAGSLSFDLASRQSVRSTVSANTADVVFLDCTTATGTDRTNIILDDTQSAGYQNGVDYEKMITTETIIPQVYTVLNGLNYSYNVLPTSSVTQLPLAIYTKTAGSTTISVDGTKVKSLSKLLLTDNGTNPAIITDLLTSNYTFTASAGTDNTRFTITAQRIPTANVVETDIDAFQLSIVNRQLSINNLLPNSSVRVFDAIGRMVINKTASNNSLEIILSAKGMYTVQIEVGGKSWVRKIVNP
jgi:hypothetical protein